MGVIEGKTYPDFELVIGNKPDFNGVIKRVNNVVLRVTNGIELEESDDCAFVRTAENEFTIPEQITDRFKKSHFSNIKSSRLFTCDMNIDTAKVLGGQSFAEIEFDLDVDFTYETQKSVPVRILR